MHIHVEGTPGFDEALRAVCDRGEADFARVEPAVREILDAVRSEGDAAVRRFDARFGGRAAEILLRRDYGGRAALERLPAATRSALELAATRIARFHERQRDVGYRYEEEGVTLGVRVRPVRRAGVYAPGGKARYPSSVLMSAIPARVAGVPEIVLATPLAGDASDDTLLAAAHVSGVTALLDSGGAQAIGALAYGTESVPRVDVVVGPGNAYVACAKRMVFGVVRIDSIAGPSEILVVADETAEARVVAADLLSQAEHDEAAYPLMVTTSRALAERVRDEVARQLAALPREKIARASVESNGHAFVVGARERAAELADMLAAEHLSLQVSDPEALLERIGAAGACFLGPLTPEAAGDYVAGPSHVLPTGGSVRFGSPLGVYDFVTRTSLIGYTPSALEAQARSITSLARVEGLEGHARAVEARIPPESVG